MRARKHIFANIERILDDWVVEGEHNVDWSEAGAGGGGGASLPASAVKPVSPLKKADSLNSASEQDIVTDKNLISSEGLERYYAAAYSYTAGGSRSEYTSLNEVIGRSENESLSHAMWFYEEITGFDMAREAREASRVRKVVVPTIYGYGA